MSSSLESKDSPELKYARKKIDSEDSHTFTYGNKTLDSMESSGLRYSKSGVSSSSLSETSSNYLCLEDITVSVDIGKGETKEILKNIDLVFKSGEVTAVMGPSGAGKTTLISLITSGGVGHRGWLIDGRVSLNGESLAKNKDSRRLLGYAPQFDALLPSLSAFDTVDYKARLKLDPKMPRHERLRRVKETMEQLKVWECRDTCIGDSNLKGVSGGEKKRISVCGELVSNPPVLILDEPTTGLDSHAATILVDQLRHVAKINNCCVILSLHQPSSSVFLGFDRVIYLAKGRVVSDMRSHEYYKACEAINLTPPRGTNIANHFMDFLQSEDTLEICMNNSSILRTISHAPPSVGSVGLSITGLLLSSNLPTGFTKMRALSSRHWKIRKTMEFSWTRIVNRSMNIIVASLVWYGRMDRFEVQADFRDQCGALFYLALEFCFQPYYGGGGDVQVERDIQKAEINSRLYNSRELSLSRIITEVALNGAAFGLQFVFVLLMAHVWNVEAWRMIACLGYIVLHLISVLSFSKMMHHISFDIRNSMVLGDLWMNLGLYLCGFYVSASTFPSWISWVKYINVVPHIFSVFVKLLFSGVSYECTAENITLGCDMVGDTVLGSDLILASGLNIPLWGSLLYSIVSIVVFESISWATQKRCLQH